ncbi:unnamed protein product [Fasciola hepatica]|uniref:Uncharacterized protein n=1 Tax=Fasciola hepatica TaxID=6192 RepID=A0ABC9HI76_FASHE
MATNISSDDIGALLVKEYNESSPWPYQGTRATSNFFSKHIYICNDVHPFMIFHDAPEVYIMCYRGNFDWLYEIPPDDVIKKYSDDGTMQMLEDFSSAPFLSSDF